MKIGFDLTQGFQAMQVNKWLIRLSAIMLTYPLASYARISSPPLTPVEQYSGFGLTIQVGNTWQDWSLNPPPSSSSSWKHGKTRLDWGINGNYQFNNHLAVATGFIGLQDITSQDKKIHSWLAYASGQLIHSLFDISSLTSVFAFGVAYHNNQLNTGPTSNYWSPWFSTRIRYNLSKNLSVSIQTAYLFGYHSSLNARHAFPVPYSYLVNASIGYQFF